MVIILESEDIAQAISMVNYEVEPDFPNKDREVSMATRRILITLILSRLGLTKPVSDILLLSQEDVIAMIDTAFEHPAFSFLMNARVEKVELWNLTGCIAFHCKSEGNSNVV